LALIFNYDPILGAAVFLERLTGGSSPEFANVLQTLNLKEFIFSPEMRILAPTLVGLGFGISRLIAGQEKIREAIEKAREKKNHILSQYLGRTEAPSAK
jgi:hypothetical protein